MKTVDSQATEYNDKYFYEVISEKDSKKVLRGPLDTIRFTVKTIDKNFKRLEDQLPFINYDFAEIINGKITRVFTKEQIIVTDFPITMTGVES